MDVKISRFLGAEQRGFHYGISTGLVLDEKTTLLDSNGNPNLAIPAVVQSYIKVGVSIPKLFYKCNK